MCLKVDISSQDEVKKMVRQVEDKFGRIDILMNVAVMYHMNSVQDLDAESWDKLTDVNLKGYWLTIQEVAPLMKKQGSGSIINLTSRGGLKAHADKAMGNYAIVKSGIAMMTRQYSRYLGPYNIRVNAIAPSLVEWEEFPGQENKKSQEDRPSVKRNFGTGKFEAWSTGPQNIPLGRATTFNEMANAAVFLASDASVTSPVLFLMLMAVIWHEF